MDLNEKYQIRLNIIKKTFIILPINKNCIL